MGMAPGRPYRAEATPAGLAFNIEESAGQHEQNRKAIEDGQNQNAGNDYNRPPLGSPSVSWLWDVVVEDGRGSA